MPSTSPTIDWLVYGREPHVANAAKSLTLDEAKAVAQDVARALTAEWGGKP